jgi:hypothetical protein
MYLPWPNVVGSFQQLIMFKFRSVMILTFLLDAWITYRIMFIGWVGQPVRGDQDMLYLWWINMKPSGLCWLSSSWVIAVFPSWPPWQSCMHNWRCFFSKIGSHGPSFTGKKIDQCKVDPDEIMILKEPISDAKRIALTVCPLTPILILSVISCR